MNYLDSSEYREWKEQLCGEYQEKFEAIERYYMQADTKESYEVQLTLSQILGDFLLAQKEEKSLESVIGKDIRKYAIQMLQAEYVTDRKGVFYWGNISVITLWLVLFMIFVKTFLFHGYDGLSFVEKTKHLYIGIFEILVVAIAYLAEFVRARLAVFLFFRPRLIGYSRIIAVLPVSFLIVLCKDYYYVVDRIIAVRIAAVLFVILAVPTTIYLVFACIINIKKTNAKKRELVNFSEELIPEQVICPKCGKEHDYDYPRCPFCGNKTVEKSVK